MSRRLVTLLALSAVIAVTAIAVPASASANLYCVEKPLCLGGTNAANPQSALTLAELHLGADTVLIGPSATPYEGPFSYTGADPVTIVGSGTGSGGTTLAAPAGVVPTLTLKHPGSTVSNLRIEVVTGPGIGLELEGTATGVRVQEKVDDNEIGPALGVFLAGGASFEQGSVAMEEGEGIASADPGNYAFVRDSTVRSDEGTGIWTGGKLSVARSTVVSASVGIEVRSLDGVGDLGNTVVRTSDDAALRATYGGTVTARHMTLLNDGDAPRGVEVAAGGPGTGGPTNLTLISSIVSGFPMTLFRQGIDSANPGNATLRYSAYDGSTGQSGSGTTDLSTGNLPGTTPAFVQRLSLPPTIVSNLRPLAPSPLIDAADPAAPPTDRDGTPREQDGDGDGVDRSDIGAFEYVPHAPTGATIAPVAAAAVGAPVQFAAGGATDPDPGETTKLVYRWDFGDGGTATGPTVSHVFSAAGPRTVSLTVIDPSRRTATTTTAADVQPGPAAKDQIAPRLSGVAVSSRRVRFTLSEPARVTLRFAPLQKRAAKRSPLTLVVDGKAGINRVRFAGRISARKQLSPGRYKLTVSAVDAAGNRSQGRVVRRLELIP